jgi:signal transduction histidine kinase
LIYQYTLANESIKQTRSIMAELSPQILNRGLLPAIEWLIDQMQMKHDLPIVLKDNNSDPEGLSVDLRITLYETIKELLLNIVKHAKASNAIVELAGVNNEFKIVIRDD